MVRKLIYTIKNYFLTIKDVMTLANKLKEWQYSQEEYI